MLRKVGNQNYKKALLSPKSKSYKTLKSLMLSDSKKTSRIDEISDGVMLVPMIIPRYSVGNAKFT